MTLNDYISIVNQRYQAGNATEHSYRGDLQQLLQTLLPDVDVTNEPKRIDCGAPDYILSRKEIPVGYIEAKDVGVELGHKSHKEQFDRYKAALGNLIITDYLQFHFYKQGELKASCHIGEISNGKIFAIPQNFDAFTNLIQNFAIQITQSIKSPVKLAQMMAAKAKLMADVIHKALDEDDANNTQSELKNQYEAFKTVLIHDISNAAFADIYAQTIAYGMFAARYHDPTLQNFSREEAARLIPQSNPFLRQLFRTVAGYNLDDTDGKRLLWIVEELVQIFLATDVASIMQNFGRATRQQDPVVHFYETFLAEYDPKLRKARGVWYTPEPVVNFIVRAVDDILKTKFNLPQGLGDTSKTQITVDVQGAGKKGKTETLTKEIHKVQILDPATGTGTFLAQVVRHIYANQFASMQGMWPQYVKEHLIPRLNGFELLMTSYAMAHLKLDMLLTETGYVNDSAADRLRIYLTNSLENDDAPDLPLFNYLSAEANEANRIKRDAPVMVVIGNPPYSGHSSNKGEWIEKLLESYKQEPTGGRLQEKNPKWLNDDYVKFIRFGQHFIDKNGEGVLAFITNHSYLDNPTFRGMRWSLMQTFDDIYILDLHGNSKKKEAAPDGGKDENVFDIQQGVSIALMVKTGKKSATVIPAKAGIQIELDVKKTKMDSRFCGNDEVESKLLANIFHLDLFGSRESKYHALSELSFSAIQHQLAPSSPHYAWVQRDETELENYNLGFSVQTLFPINSVGIVTSRDDLVIDSNKENLKQRMQQFFSLSAAEAMHKFSLNENQSWTVAEAQRKTTFDISHIQPISYRPFDNRWVYYDSVMIERARGEVMKQMLNGENFGLIVGRAGQVVGDMPWNVCSITDKVSDFNLFYRGGGVLFPLYTYPNAAPVGAASSRELLFGVTDPSYNNTRTPNLNMQIVSAIAEGLGLTFTAEKTNPTLTLALSQKEREYSPQPLSQVARELSPSPAGGRGVGEREHFAPIDLLDYIYAVLHSPTYRETYKEFLKIDFPRVPYPKDSATFWQLVALGTQLRQTHLLETCPATQYPCGLQSMPISYPVGGNNVVDKPRFEAGKVYINATQYFENVPELAWQFYIGGYQPAQKWLKDRKGRALNHEDIAHYQKIIFALTNTHRLMQAVDAVFSV
jgi:predicted helicase